MEEAATAAAEARKLFRGTLPKPIFIKQALYDRYLQGYKSAGFDRDVSSKS